MKSISMKRFFSGLLMCVMLFNCLAVAAFAEEKSGLCEHHAAHDELCGYAEAVEASPCTHEHVENCAEVCSHSHDDLCGYAEAVEAKPCGNIPCESCAALLMGDKEAAEELTEEPVEEPVEEPAEGGEEEVTEEVPAIMSLSSDIGSGTPDSTPPELVSVSLSASTVTAPSDVEVTVDAADAVSGLDWGEVYFSCESTGKNIWVRLNSSYYDNDSHEEVKYADGKLHGTLKIDQYVESGTFTVEYISVYDVAGNGKGYHRNGNQFDEQLPDSVLDLHLNVVDPPAADSTPPELVSVSLSASTVTAPGEVEVTVEATDAVSGLDWGEVYFSCESTGKNIWVRLNSSYYDNDSHEEVKYADGKLHGTLKIDQYVESGTFTVEYISVYDVAGNGKGYHRNGNQFDEQLPDSVLALHLEVTESETPDSTPPELVGVSLSTASITAPGIAEVTVDAADAVSGLDWGEVYFSCESTGKNIWVRLNSSYYDNDSHEEVKYADGKLHGTLKIDQYVESGTFTVEYISVYDVAGNGKGYHRNSNQFDEQLPDSVLALQLRVRNTGADVTTSLANSSFVEEVENAGNSAYIVADYSGNSNMPQEAFDAIAGTDKTLELMSSGVTWRFEGEDIVNTSKDIDLNVDIVPVEQDSSSAGGDIQEELGENPGVVMRFAENGQLPGKATIQVKLDYAMREYLGRSKGLCVYYHNNQTGQMELVAADVQVVDDSYVEFTIYHCSDYVLTRDPEIVQNRLDMSNVGADGGEIWVDGSRYSVQSSGGSSYLDLPDGNAKAMVSFSYHVGDANDVHTQYPIGMKVWALKLNEYGTYTASYVEELDNILQYSGSSIRIAGNKGIRMISSIENSKKAALTSGGLAGYKLLEYGTVLALASELEGGKPLILGEPYARSNYAYKRGVADPVFQYEGDLVQYTNVLVGFSLDQCKEDIAMRPYMILEDADGQQITIYGGTVYRSIGYIAWQNRKAFGSGSAAYEYVWEIIHHVYGDIYDEDYKA